MCLINVYFHRNGQTFSEFIFYILSGSNKPLLHDSTASGPPPTVVQAPVTTGLTLVKAYYNVT